jgi:glutathione S-transferase
MKIYGHPWSINTRKVLLVLAEKGREAELALVMLPKGEQKRPEHLARHPFGKVPVLDDDGFVVYEVDAINRYLEQRFPSPALVPADARAAALMTQWISAADSYFVPHAGPLIVETLFRRYLGGETDHRLVESAREKLGAALDAADRWLATRPYFAGDTFSLADVHFLPYLDYLENTGQNADFRARRQLSAWFDRASGRASWKKVALTGPQPYEAGMTAEALDAR